MVRKNKQTKLLDLNTKNYFAGFNVIATLLPHETQEHLQKYDIATCVLDVTDERSVADLRDYVTELTGGQLDVLVNNAYVKTRG